MLADTAASGSRLSTLRVARDDLAARMDACSSDQNYATLGRLLTDVLAQIADLEGAVPQKKGTALDELAAKRKASGRPDASGVAGSAVKPKRR